MAEAEAEAEAESPKTPRFRVGYALPPKKIQSFILPSFLTHAKDRGIDLIQVHLHEPLLHQGPFHCLLHKLYGDDWKRQLLDFMSKYPNVVIIDCPSAIEPLHSRTSMLEFVKHLQLPIPTQTLDIPKQVVVTDAESLELALQLQFPVIAKPLLANGSDKSHQMSLVLNMEGLKKVKPPVVLQEFVNHGGVIFKVYVAGDHVQCVKRRSLADISEHKLKLGSIQGGILSFSQISNLKEEEEEENENDGNKCDGIVMNSIEEEAEMPPLDFIHNIAQGLRHAMRLHLFNFDMIRDASAPNRYLVIDINYFPGYAKVPGFESMLTAFLLDVVADDKKGGSLMDSLADVGGVQV